MHRIDSATRPNRAFTPPRSLRIVLFLALVIAAVFASLAAPRAFADGVFVPPADTRIPGEPAQRALIVHREGVERLVVESVALAEVAGDHAWIIPVPAAPSRLEAVHPDTLAALDLLVGPEIVTEWSKNVPSLGPEVAVLWALFATGMSLVVYFHRKANLVTFTIFFAITMIALAILVPNFLGARGAGPPGVSAGRNLFEGRVGSYEVIVCDVPDAVALDARMQEAALGSLPPEVAKLVDDHAREGWKFVVARLAASGAGPLAPHPLLVEFACERPVFPMRLTAAAGSETNVRLWVASDAPVECDRLETVVRGRFEMESPKSERGDRHEILRCRSHSMGIAHPELLGLIADRPWSNGPWITRLERDLRSEEMDRDLVLEPTEATPYRKKLHTPGVRRAMALASALPFYGVGALISAFAFGGSREERKDRRYLAGLLASALLTGAIYLQQVSAMPLLVLPEGVRFRPEPGSGLWTPRTPDYVWIEAIEGAFDIGPAMRPPAEVTDDELVAMVEAVLVRQWNPVLGRPARPSTLPYDYRIERGGPEGPVAIFVDEHGGREEWNLRAEYAEIAARNIPSVPSDPLATSANPKEPPMDYELPPAGSIERIEVAGADAVAEWERLRAGGGVFPVLAAGLEPGDLVIPEPDELAAWLAEAAKIDAEALLAERYFDPVGGFGEEHEGEDFDDEAGEEESDEDLDEEVEDDAPSSESGDDDDAGESRRDEPVAIRDILTGVLHPKVEILLLRGGADWMVPCRLGFGGWNDCPSPAEQSAVLASWNRRYGAVVEAITRDTIEMRVERPPTTPEAARALAIEQYAFCPDMVDQSDFGEDPIGELAESILNANRWYFWWD